MPRGEPGAVLHDPGEIAERTVRMVLEGVIRAQNGADVPVDCDTVLLHGDTPGAIETARRVRAELSAAGVVLAPLSEVLGRAVS